MSPQSYIPDERFKNQEIINGDINDLIKKNNNHKRFKKGSQDLVAVNEFAQKRASQPIGQNIEGVNFKKSNPNNFQTFLPSINTAADGHQEYRSYVAGMSNSPEKRLDRYNSNRLPLIKETSRNQKIKNDLTKSISSSRPNRGRNDVNSTMKSPQLIQTKQYLIHMSKEGGLGGLLQNPYIRK